jgi:hypothetical protein
MEQLVILLLIALISLINWIIQKSKETREKRQLEKRADTTGETVKHGMPESPPVAEAETAMRRLREALGLPEEAEPPVIPRRAQPEIPPPAPPREPVRLPPRREVVTPPPLPEVAKRPAVVRVPFTPPRLEHRKFELPHLELRKFGLPHRLAKPIAEVEVPGPPSRVRELLTSQGGLRDAVVVSEVLGPPKSLRGGEFRS